MAAIELERLTKVYADGTRAVHELDLEIADGEFVVFVGPSGCGKTSALRMIAGLEDITSGTVRVGDEIVNDLPPKARDIAMIFQNYALYPHMNVYDNMAFGLKMRGLDRGETRRRVESAARVLGLSEVLKKRPRHLSGGQRQRVAMGRAIVREPQAFLMDEPLSNLDAKLRVQTRTELVELQQRLAVTTVYVTHDQVEAMTLADRIVLLRDGRIEQQGSPLELFERPATGFVASFLGSPSINLIPARLVNRDKAVAVLLESGEVLELPDERARGLEGYTERAVTFGIRPQHLSRAGRGTAPSGSARITATADLIQPTGTRTYVTSRIGGVPVTAELDAHDVHEQGIVLDYAVDMSRCLLIDPATDKVI